MSYFCLRLFLNYKFTLECKKTNKKKATCEYRWCYLVRIYIGKSEQHLKWSFAFHPSDSGPTGMPAFQTCSCHTSTHQPHGWKYSLFFFYFKIYNLFLFQFKDVCIWLPSTLYVILCGQIETAGETLDEIRGFNCCVQGHRCPQDWEKETILVFGSCF